MKKYGVLYVGLCSIAGFVTGYLTSDFDSHERYPIYMFSATIAAFLLSVISWKVITRKRAAPVKNDVIGVSILVGMFGHPLTFIITSLIYNAIYEINEKWASQLEGTFANLSDLLVHSIFLSYFSLIMYGIYTIPTAVLIGLFVNYLQERHNSAWQE